MVLEKLGSSLREALRKIAGASYIDESLIKEIVRDIQRALIQADVNVQLALTITKQLQRRALEEKPPPGMSPREHVVRIIYEELVKILGASREVPFRSSGSSSSGCTVKARRRPPGSWPSSSRRRGCPSASSPRTSTGRRRSINWLSSRNRSTPPSTASRGRRKP